MQSKVDLFTIIAIMHAQLRSQNDKKRISLATIYLFYFKQKQYIHDIWQNTNRNSPTKCL